MMEGELLGRIMVEGPYCVAYDLASECRGTLSATAPRAPGALEPEQRLANKSWRRPTKLVALGEGRSGWNVYSAKSAEQLEGELRELRSKISRVSEVLVQFAAELRSDTADLETFARGRLTLDALPRVMDRAHSRAGVVAQTLDAIVRDLRGEQ